MMRERSDLALAADFIAFVTFLLVALGLMCFTEAMLA